MREFDSNNLLDQCTVDLMLGGALVPNDKRDNRRAVLAMKAGVSKEIIMEKRRKHRVWMTIVQRKYQSQRPRRQSDRVYNERWIRCES